MSISHDDEISDFRLKTSLRLPQQKLLNTQKAIITNLYDSCITDFTIKPTYYYYNIAY